MNKIFFNRALDFGEMYEQAFPYPDNITPLSIYRKSMEKTPDKLTRMLEQKRSPSYRSMEKLNLLL